MLLRVCVLGLLCACGDKAEEDDEAEDSGSAVTTGGAEDVAGDWEGVCAFPSYDISIDLVLNQTDRDLTGGADIYFTTDKLYEYGGSATGTVTLAAVDLDIVFDKYGTLVLDAAYSTDEDAGDRLIGTCKEPGGESGNLSLAR